LPSPASAECRTSEITPAEFKTLCGKVDAANPRVHNVTEYLGGTANWRTDLNSRPTSCTLLRHKETFELFKSLGVTVAPELKSRGISN
jgi:glycerophosphoryl diester phosphodiesterase